MVESCLEDDLACSFARGQFYVSICMCWIESIGGFRRFRRDNYEQAII
jgi:hypothetical protein